ncbi:MAG: hypothetical protein A2V66_05410 [Ignavibacteria bacterium RBG_13_36_8]|nr:MAG: hypothetical protein A2V66_05410 [Ignavibacteria bacterium RBG_13_36_8]
MKNYLTLFVCLFIITDQSVANKIQKSTEADSPVTIYYGLNESHSRDWAQINANDVVGITYFQRFGNSYNEGTLVYKTINPDGSENIETVTTGNRLEISVLLFDELCNPHIFVASSTDYDQIIDHYYKNGNGQWQSETIIHFYNEGGKFIYELSADIGPDYSFHLLILKTRSNIDSDDFFDAWINSYLYHLTNATGSWVKELIDNYDMAYTYDMYIKSSIRQDIKVDDNGFAHVTFGEQINAADDPSRLRYATNKTGNWVIETALNYDAGSRDDAGWFPSLCLDNNGTPYISCMYVKRVYTYSATYCRLLLLKRLGNNNWHSEIIADHDDGYYGGDGRNYTGALSHLVFDKNNTPHIIFSDIASTHWPGSQLLNIGNIRYGVLKNGVWDITTIYRQPLPTGFVNATEMHGLCLLISDLTDTIRVIGQELKITGENQYTCSLINFEWDDINAIDNTSIYQYKLNQNYPNPFNSSTLISYTVPRSSFVTLKVYDLLGREIQTLVNETQEADSYSIRFDGSRFSTGIYIYRLQSGNEFTETNKMVFIK